MHNLRSKDIATKSSNRDIFKVMKIKYKKEIILNQVNKNKNQRVEATEVWERQIMLILSSFIVVSKSFTDEIRTKIIK